MDRYRIQLLSQEGQDNLFPLIHAESLNTIDLNNMREEGIFYFNANNSATNAPTGATSGFGLQILRLTDSNYLQMAYLNEGSGTLQTRIFNGSSWSVWSELSGGNEDTVNWNDITNIPSTLVTNVNISGSGNAVTNAEFSGGILSLTKGTISEDAGDVYWDDILNKPTWITTVNNNDMTGLHSLLSQSNLQLLNVPIDRGFNIAADDWSSTSDSLQSIMISCEYPYYEYSNGAFTRSTYQHTLRIEIPEATEDAYGVVKLSDIGGGGSSVSVQAVQTSGTHIATITVDGSATQLFAPTAGGTPSLPNQDVVTIIEDSEASRSTDSLNYQTSYSLYNLSSGSTSASNTLLDVPLATHSYAGIITAGQYDLLEEYNLNKDTYVTNGTVNTYIENYLDDNANSLYVKLNGDDTKTGNFAIRPSSGTSTYPFSIYPATTTSTTSRASFGMIGSDPQLNLTVYDTSGGGHMVFSVPNATGVLNVASGIIVSGTSTFNGAISVPSQNLTISGNGSQTINSTASRWLSLFNGLTGTQQRGIIFQKSGSSGSENVQIQRSINGALSGSILQFNIDNGQTEFFAQCNFTSGVFSGTVTASAFYQSSDKNYKENIVAIDEEDIEKVKNIELVSYNFKNDTTKRYGVIAQEIEEAGLANIVHTDADNKKTVDYISLLILKIEQLQKEVNELKSKVYAR